MKITYKQLFDIRNSVLKLAGCTLDIVTAFKIRKFIKAIVEEVKELQETHLKLIKKYGKKKEDGNWEVPDDSENYSAFESEWNKILEEEIDLPEVKVKLEDLQIVIEEGSEGKPAKRKNILNNLDVANLEFLIQE